MVRVIAEKYEIVGVLGEGGTGVVYDAIRIDDRMSVALKVMHAELAGDGQIRGRFKREAAVLRRLEGPHICPILDFGEAAGEEGKSVLYIALPKIEGVSLEHVMKDGLLDVDRALDVMIEICAALRAAHQHGIIHRDLKPANVMLKANDQVVVVDFGLSKIVTGGGLGTTNLTTHNMVFGTPEYMSPEQARGDDIDARSDVYAAGIMLYELLVGVAPFRGPTPLSVLTAHLTSELASPSTCAREGRVTPALESVVRSALARDRDLRYASASALSAAILHARAAPDDVASTHPEALATLPAGMNAFAATVLAIGTSSAPPPAVVASAAPAAARATGAPRAASSPPKEYRPPSSPPTARPPSSRSRPARVPPPAPDLRLWVLLWVVAGIASVGLGVYFALRR